MKLAIVGYGKMGRTIEQVARDTGWTIHARINSADELPAAEGADVAVEFTTARAVPANIEALAALRVPMVVGTTGWLAELPRAEAAVTAAGTGMVRSANYSVGAQLFARMVREAAALLSEHPQYGARGWDTNPGTTTETPSDELAALLEGMRKAGYIGDVALSGSPAGTDPGTHEIGFESSDDTITMRHAVRNRDGIARGALLAARWVACRTGLFTFEDVLFMPRDDASGAKSTAEPAP